MVSIEDYNALLWDLYGISMGLLWDYGFAMGMLWVCYGAPILGSLSTLTLLPWVCC